MGVFVGGTPFLPTPFRWGYGWPYFRGYGVLSTEEEALIAWNLGLKSEQKAKKKTKQKKETKTEQQQQNKNNNKNTQAKTNQSRKPRRNGKANSN
jgi:hypothetical protein